jgi:O-antigen/teichoic acid export membrane protein
LKISTTDVLWNLGATLLRVASGIILLPLALRTLSAEDVGLWTVFITVGSFTVLMDFGFTQAFSRNLIYIFSGVKYLKSDGYDLVKGDTEVDYSLLKGVLSVMRKYYLIMALVLLFIMVTAGSFYISSILRDYTGNYSLAIISWVLYTLLTVYQMYTLYYEALMQGRGFITQLKKIIIISQVLEIIVTASFLVAGFGIFSMVTGKLVSVFINRVLCYRTFFDPQLLDILKSQSLYSPKELFEVISPNAIKIGITSLGGFLVQRSSFFIGSLYLPLSDIASYGITIQVLNLLAAVSNIYIATYLPKITYDRVNDNNQSIKRLYLQGLIAMTATYFAGSVFLVLLGNPVLELIHSKTFFVIQPILILALVLSMVETNFVMAGNILHTKNEVPFFKASIFSGIAIFILILLSFEFTSLGLYGMVIVPLLVDLAYQGWKWPWEVIREFKIKSADFRDLIKFNQSN